MLTGPAWAENGEREDAPDGVVDVADRPGLRAVAGHGQRPAGERLTDERGDGPAVVGAHPGAVGVEDPDDAGVGALRRPVRRRQRLAEPLGLVVDAARADRVHVAPVLLRLRVLQRVAVDLRRRREHVPGPLLLRESEGVQGAEAADLERLDRHPQVVERARRRREVQDEVDRAGDVHVVGDVAPDQPEPRLLHEVHDVAGRSGQEVVQADDLHTAIEQVLAEVRSEEPGAPGHHRPPDGPCLAYLAGSSVIRRTSRSSAPAGPGPTGGLLPRAGVT